MAEMLETIENAIKTRLTNAGLNIFHLDEKAQLDPEKDAQTDPVGRIITQSGDFEFVTQIKIRCKVRIIFVLDFMHAINDTTRERGLYPLLFGIINYLYNKTLDLQIAPIQPVRFERDWEEEKRQGSVATYALIMETSYVITELDEEQAVDLLRVGLEYYLQDPEDDDVLDASDLIDFEIIPYIRFPRTVFDYPYVVVDNADTWESRILLEPIIIH